MSPLGAALGLVFGVWLVLTVLNQFRKPDLLRVLRPFDPFALIPSWTFFAPNPAVNDVNLLVRDELGGGVKSPWREVDQLHPNPWRALWHPEKRTRKAVYDLSVSVGELVRDTTIDPELYSYDLAYLLLLNHTSSQPRSALTTRRQFMVVRSRGYADDRAPAVVFVSWFHRLAEVPPPPPFPARPGSPAGSGRGVVGEGRRTPWPRPLRPA